MNTFSPKSRWTHVMPGEALRHGRVWPLNQINEIIDKWGLGEEDYSELRETLASPFTHLD